MKIPWADRRCIVCTREAQLTVAHVLPRSVGGRLTASFECDECNHRLGKIESRLKNDPCVRFALESIADRGPALADQMRERQTFTAQNGTVRIDGTWSDGRFRVRDTPQDDRSIVKGPTRARDDIRTQLTRMRLDDASINHALEAHERAPLDQVVDLGHGIKTRKGAVERFDPVLGMAGPVPDLCLLAIAYRFLAILVSDSVIYSPVLAPIRRVLNGQDAAAAWNVEWLQARTDIAPWHGLALRTLAPTVIEIRMFGQIAWDDVTFAGVALAREPERIAYRIDLGSSGSEEFPCTSELQS